jgi:hypothetical protein
MRGIVTTKDTKSVEDHEEDPKIFVPFDLFAAFDPLRAFVCRYEEALTLCHSASISSSVALPSD